jgi:putative transposase
MRDMTPPGAESERRRARMRARPTQRGTGPVQRSSPLGAHQEVRHLGSPRCPARRRRTAEAAAVRGGDVAGVIFHSDDGSEHSAGLFEAACQRLGVSQSMGRVGSCFENAASESFHSTLEFELLRKHHFATRADARMAVAAYIDRSDRTRRHSSCEMRSPVDYEAILATGAAGTVNGEEAA